MRRALLAITGLAASTTALVAFKGAPDATPVAQDLPAGRASAVPGGAAPEAPTATPGPTGTPAARPSATPKPGASTSASADRTPSARASTTRGGTGGKTTAPRTTAPSAPRTSTPPKSTTRTVTGPVITNEYGNVQVQITVSGTRITNAVALELPDGGQSGQRSDRVDAAYSGTSGQVVRQQSASLDTVSGATYTSQSYRQSLQAAIDQAR
ncbi:FMN-binding protein [Micromonospora sp. NPDC000089]|uniref:FMN-binding protein n=1 Tax=unclassified Micromonospora TaxID=2617518 RepID=UPI0036B7D11D